ncbi:glycosyltransferase [Spirochaeta africana]|uniref:Glycosyltransferase n=1 Tax=Spirochaeta africana (strain ATCC 700263 / DSM 8902 / Z-7692) TaxID=889378 RepID=H9UFA9_SPIAZ|nr:glycosyltransferase [Spirochaeta africana]AFG36202.1 glycosyltransferase [Spirochaeta africana DSM 8902]
MRIVFSTDTYWPRVNGVAVSVEVFRRELNALGHEVLILAPEYPENIEHEPESADIVRLPSRSLFFSSEDRLIDVSKAQKAATEALRNFKPDILHAHTEFNGLEILLDYRRKHKVPLVMTSHTYWERYIKVYLPFLPAIAARRAAIAVTRLRFRKANQIIAPSQSMKAVLQSYKIRKPITIIPTGISADDFSGIDRSLLRARVAWLQGRPAGTRVLTFIGRLSQEKNPSFLLPVLEQVRKTLPDTILLYVGDGPGRADLERQAAVRGLQDQVVFLGYLPRTRLREVYGTTDVFTFPSKTETQGLVTIEAMICGTPVVAIGEMGTREIMNGDNGGFMVPDDQQQFTSRVLQLLNDDRLWQAKSAEARLYAGNYTSAALTDRLVTVYQGLPKRR